ncbi:MAG: exodeoxyribonuclease III [Alphaproteobacteria bacterium]
MISIATWNVNSVKSRLTHLTGWLKEDGPDIVLLQELKCIDDAFPAMEIEELGYNIAAHGQKTYNGVAILSKFPLDDIMRGLPDNDNDDQARYIEAVASVPGGAIRVASVYVPNGQTTDSDKYHYKLSFLDKLHAHCKTLLGYEEQLVIGGDYNIAPEDVDVHNPKHWEGSVLTHDTVRAAFRRMLNLGLYNAIRPVDGANPQGGQFSWWDYRGGAYQNDDGLLIDHLLLSPQAMDALEACGINRGLRELEKPSDHTPVVATLSM